MISKQLLSLLPLALAVPTTRPEYHGTTVSMKPRATYTKADGTVNWMKLLSHVNHTLVKYNSEALPALKLHPVVGAKSKRSNVELTDQVDGGEDTLYFGSGSVGDQSFTFDFDTGSSDIFVPGPQCNANAGCVGQAKYDESGSDQKRTTTVTYGSGQVGGEDFIDAVSVGGLTSPEQGFISLTSAQGFSTSQSDGLFGMGFSSIANTGFTTFFENLMNLGRVSANEFSFYLGRAQSNTQDGSLMTLGGRNTSKFTGSVISVPVTKKGYWQVAIDGATVNSRDVPLTSGQAAIDTGTTLVLAPSAAASSIFSSIPGSFPIPLGSGSPTITLYAYPCNTDERNIPSLKFAGTEFAINSLDFNFGILSANNGGSLPLVGGILDLGSLLGSLLGGADEYCIAGLGGADLSPTQNLWVVGDTFLKNWYSIYSYDNGASVSFARAV